MTKTIIAIIAMVMTSCAPKSKESKFSEVDEQLYARALMKDLASEMAEIPPAERSSMRCMEQIYTRLHPNDQDFSRFVKDESYRFKDLLTGKNLKYDLMVFPNPHGRPGNDAVFIAAPRPISLGADREIRVVLMHNLEVVELDERAYHLIVIKQFRLPGEL